MAEMKKSAAHIPLATKKRITPEKAMHFLDKLF
jgi:hypothetical protein